MSPSKLFVLFYLCSSCQTEIKFRHKCVADGPYRYSRHKYRVIHISAHPFVMHYRVMVGVLRGRQVASCICIRNGSDWFYFVYLFFLTILCPRAKRIDQADECRICSKLSS